MVQNPGTNGFLSISPQRGYYFRWVIPSDARHLFGGRREIRKSLKTYNRKVATTLAASLIYEMKRKIYKESVPEDVVVPQPAVVRCYHPEEVCKEISFKTDDGIEIVINHDDPAEELRQAKQLAKELKGKHATPASEDSPLISEIIEKYCQVKILERSWTPKTEDENRAIFNVFLRNRWRHPCKGIRAPGS